MHDLRLLPIMPAHPALRPMPAMPDAVRIPAGCLLETECLVHVLRMRLIRAQPMPIVDVNVAIDRAIAKLVAARVELNCVSASGDAR